MCFSQAKKRRLPLHQKIPGKIATPETFLNAPHDSPENIKTVQYIIENETTVKSYFRSFKRH